MTHTLIHPNKQQTHKISIWIMDEDRLVAELLTDFLLSTDRICQINKVESKDMIVSLRRSLAPPDMILMDLKSNQGLDLIDILKRDFPDISLILLSTNYEIVHTGFLFKAGFSAFLPKKGR